MNPFDRAISTLEHTEPLRITGAVAAMRGLTILVDDLPVETGTFVSIGTGARRLYGEVVGFEDRRAIVMTLNDPMGVRPRDPVVAEQSSPTVHVGPYLRGRVLNGLGETIDGLGPVMDLSRAPINPLPISPLARARCDRQLVTGVRAIDLMTAVGRGQRMGIFAGPGVGKSTLLGMIAQKTRADVNVIALIGERGREVREFLDDALGPEGLARSVVVVATSDEAPLLRVRAALVATTIAEFFRDRGDDVMLMVDSITRFAHAKRQIGLAVGEPPATRGYTPSVFSALPLLLERAGATKDEHGERLGSITAFYTILVEGDDMTEPVSDAARGILDGHVVLSRRLAHRGHFPAVDVLDSVSRVAGDVTTQDQQRARQTVTRLLAAHAEAEDLIQIGAYAQGSDPTTDAAIACKPIIDNILQQRNDDDEPHEEALARFLELAKQSQILTEASSKQSEQRGGASR
ncbi:MAG: FliI/YscN family ATPase [Phycisphaerales bacterium]